ncbi:DNA adenine methylase [Salmonella enterica]|uniref:site-specific DNA-methyltransferase (adenine-specific) n=13 Tax=Salmonella enterica TaxID=28901 RepID=A0A5X8SXV2_SALET|nr:DNA adenine methylase [Salmonella enterica]EAA3003294.1 DNA adenine methylase [Salmonella enterica subsp. enterica serovar Muenster]EAA3109620.1 DNA adenine methylase [Salmonella enterica subsp. enterica serovar Duisburg]EAA6922681.1 DNA adenine methylase [Salmonella enterica subsp. enterica serovar Pomona]EAB8551766.1 DNA adenine methylase [Salmonella enterica subsp. enterica serovar Infantis]EBC9523003.1 DNA adenine methylase [Salmonella enterica subsp. enterica serovar Agona]EBL5953267.
MKFYTPLRYPGGKGKLSYFLKDVIEQNSLNDGAYAEPYAGGAGVALELLLEEYVRKIYINDADFAVYSFWSSVINDTDNLCRLISNAKINMDEWRFHRYVISNPTEFTKLEIGFSAFFLNRTNRSGILKAGVIGGKAQNGKWRMDVRFNRDDLISRIENIANYNQRIVVTNLDALEFLEALNFLDSVDKADKNKTLLYLDPPYYIKGQGLYRNFYEHDDHVLVMEKLRDINFPKWLVSYDNAKEIKDIYSDFPQVEYSLQYTAQQKKSGEEVMIFSPEVVIPDTLKGVSMKISA